MLLRGSEIQAALFKSALKDRFAKFPYKTQMAIYGVELINPMIQEFLLQMAAVGQILESSEIPRASAKVRLAPLDAAHISIVTKSGGVTYQFDPILGLQLQRNSR
jgi:hypothetical protein